jgi:HEAT repeat protein
MKVKSILSVLGAVLLATVIQIALDARAASEEGEQATASSNQVQKFTTVEGADLKSKIDAATRLARSRAASSPFWVAYSFDVRPGIGVDPNGSSFSGSMMSFGGTTLFIGTSNGMPVETRNLGIFALIEPSNNSVTRVEIYNLEKQREYGGYPVYWLGRAGNQESLDYLKRLAETGDVRRVAEGAASAIGMHDAAQVNSALKDLARRSSVKDVREVSVFWLGFIGGEQAFLADIVRNEQEHADVRESAAAAIGRSRDGAALAQLQSLYSQVTIRDVKEQILNSISKNDDQKAAADFLVKVLKTDADRDLREAALHRLGKLPGTQALLVEVVRNEQEHAGLREAAVHAIGKGQDQKAIATLQGLFKSIANADVREAILHSVAKNQDRQSAMHFLVEVAKGDASQDLREQAVHSLGKMEGTGPLLLEIARNEKEDEDVRGAAIHAIGRSADAAALSTLQSLYESVTDTAVKEQALHSIAKNQDQEAALNFIIKVAEGDANRDLREQAIHRLGKSSSARALDVLKRIAMSAGNDSDLQEQAVHAIGKRPNDEAVPALIEIAKTNSQADVREAAVRRLSKTNDERAREFLKQLISN